MCVSVAVYDVLHCDKMYINHCNLKIIRISGPPCQPLICVLPDTDVFEIGLHWQPKT